MINRRAFLKGLFATPAIVQASTIMPIWVPPRTLWIIDKHESSEYITGQYRHRITYLLGREASGDGRHVNVIADTQKIVEWYTGAAAHPESREGAIRALERCVRKEAAGGTVREAVGFQGYRPKLGDNVLAVDQPLFRSSVLR